MNEFLFLFVREVVDINIDQSFVDKYLDKDGLNFRLGDLISSDIVKRGLGFRHLWYNVLGTYPSKQITRHYLENVHDTSTMEFWNYLKRQMPIFNFVNVDVNALDASRNKFFMHLTIDKIKTDITKKFCQRFGMISNILETQLEEQNLSDIFKTCLQNASGFELLKAVSIGLAKIQKVPVVQPNISIKTMYDYFTLQEKIIEYYNLRYYNIFSKSWNTNPAWKGDKRDMTVFDCICNTTHSDGAFLKSIIGSLVIYNTTDYVANEMNRMSLIIEAYRSGQKDGQVVIFDASDIKTNQCFYNYNMIHPFVSMFVPRFAKHFVCIGQTIYPPIESLIVNKANAIYYSLDTFINKNYKQNIETYNRCVTNDLTNIEKISEYIQDKKTYVVVDKNLSEIQCTQDLIFNDHYAKWQWKLHLSLSCPFQCLQMDSYRSNILLYDQFLMKNYIQNMERLDTIRLKQDSDYAVVIMDNRKNIQLVISLFTTLMNLKPEFWKVIIVCNEQHKDFYTSCINLLDENKNCVEFIVNNDFKTDGFNLDIYNDILKSPQFWDALNCKTGLFIQDDGMITRPGMEEEFLKYDYVGAPWERTWPGPNKHIADEINPEMVGNGGVSIRNVPLMSMICKTYSIHKKNLHYDNIQQQPEDVFFSCYSNKEGLKMPDYETAKKFSTEQIVYLNSYGFHKFWVYHNTKIVEQFFDNILKTAWQD